MMRYWRVIIACVCATLATPALAVDGISVTCHWSGRNHNLYGGYGNIVRHDIEDSEAVERTVLYDGGDARHPVISPDGKRVAFLREDGAICVMSIDGGKLNVVADNSHGEPVMLHERAMDAGPNGTGHWLGHVYNHLRAYHLPSDTAYPTDRFVGPDGETADGQTCNGSMAPDDSARLMLLTIPHDYIDIYSHDAQADRFVRTSRHELPPGQADWHFPEWSTDAGYFTAVAQPGTLKYQLHVVRVREGRGRPEALAVTPPGSNVSFSHLYVQP